MGLFDPPTGDWYSNVGGGGLFGGPVTVPSGRSYMNNSLPSQGLFGVSSPTPFSSQIGPMPQFMGSTTPPRGSGNAMFMGGYGAGGSSGSGSGYDAAAAAAAERERQAALSLLDPSQVLDDPYMQAASAYYRDVLGGSALPYGEKQKNLMYSRASDEIAAAQGAQNLAATRRAASMGLGRGAALDAQLRAAASQAALGRQGARSDIENQATMANTQARQYAASGLGSLAGTRQSLANQLRTQAANLRANTQYRGGAGGTGGTSGTGTSRTYNPALTGVNQRGVYRNLTTGLRSIGGSV